ncbi:MAG TPA: polysaccharide biosynthesis/export family protein [Longimicrobiales bacterium]|nr:polysaccharide biosynthesis/export family protein [Longimicrobiales bacterium]
MKRLICALAMLLLTSGPVAAQQGWDPTGVQLTRSELQELLSRYEETASSSAYSGEVRAQARDEAALIRTRLDEGDLRVGDRIELTVEGHQDLTAEFAVVAGRVLVLPAIGEVSVAGVLRSELQDHLTREIARYIRDPVVRARSLIRLEVIGAVGAQGFYTIPSDILITDALMQAGGPSAEADLEKIRIERNRQVIWSSDRLRRAMQEGRTLDQLSIRAGDGIIVPQRTAGEGWWRTGLMILTGISTAFIAAERIF